MIDDMIAPEIERLEAEIARLKRQVWWAIVVVACVAVVALFGGILVEREVQNLAQKHDDLRRSYYCNNHIEAVYWKPKIYEALPRDQNPNAYYEACTEAGRHWFPEDK